MLVIISGPSGVGKTTITRAVEQRFDDACFSVSTTTRPKTDADTEGVDYHFVDEAAFLEAERQGAFIETAEVFGNRYGTPRAWVEQRLIEGRLVILEIDVQGAIRVKQQMPEAFAMFILPPSDDDLLERLRRRQRDDEATIQRRFAEARREMSQARECGVYDLFIVNAEVDRAVESAVDAVNGERAARA